jgi:excisionase family DNA binding protein
MDEFLTVEELATKFKVSDQTIYNLIKKGEIKVTRIGDSLRISSEEYLRLIGKDGNAKDK